MKVFYSGTSVVGLALNVLTFNASGGAPDVAAVRAAYLGLAGNFPSGVTIQFDGSGDLFDSTNGHLVGAWTATPPAAVVGGGTNKAAAGVGACINWKTSTIVGTRRVRGRTFLVPYSSDSYDLDGRFTTTVDAKHDTFGAAMIAVTGFGVWHRPTTPGGSDGAFAPAVGFSPTLRVGVLLSRRV